MTCSLSMILQKVPFVKIERDFQNLNKGDSRCNVIKWVQPSGSFTIGHTGHVPRVP